MVYFYNDSASVTINKNLFSPPPAPHLCCVFCVYNQNVSSIICLLRCGFLFYVHTYLLIPRITNVMRDEKKKDNFIRRDGGSIIEGTRCHTCNLKKKGGKGVGKEMNYINCNKANIKKFLHTHCMMAFLTNR